MATEKAGKGPARPQASTRPSADGGLQRTGKYLSEVRAELKKTTWPTRQEVIVQTQVVLGLLVVVGVFIATWDFILGQVFFLVLRLLGVELNS